MHLLYIGQCITTVEQWYSSSSTDLYIQFTSFRKHLTLQASGWWLSVARKYFPADSFLWTWMCWKRTGLDDGSSRCCWKCFFKEKKYFQTFVEDVHKKDQVSAFLRDNCTEQCNGAFFRAIKGKVFIGQYCFMRWAWHPHINRRGIDHIHEMWDLTATILDPIQADVLRALTLI